VLVRPRFRKPIVALSAVAAVLAMTGCQASGGGTLASACPTERAPATFGFTFQGSDTQGFPAVGTLTGTYRDPGACAFPGGVALRGVGHRVAPASPLGPPTAGSAGAFFVDYESTNPANPGTGQLSLYVTDSGVRGPSAGDSFTIAVLSGPYAQSAQHPLGYVNSQLIQHGNITVLQGSPIP
jgi:hypothetical protein